MRLGLLLISLEIWGLVACGNDSYRLGRTRSSDSVPAGGTAGERARGGGDADASAGVGGSAAGAVGAAGGVGSTSTDGSGGSGMGGIGGSGPMGGTAGIGGTAGTESGGTAGTGASPLTRDVVMLSSEVIRGLAADEQHVFFTGDQVWRMDHSGAGLVQLAEGPAAGMTTDATHVYWSTHSEIRRIAKTGGLVEIVTVKPDAGDSPINASSLAVDDSMVYVPTYLGQTVVRAPKTGGFSQPIARAAKFAGAVAVRGSWLYWAEYANDGNAGAIHRIDLVTETADVLHPEAARFLLPVDGYVWSIPWAMSGLLQVPLDGGQPKRYTAASFGLGSDGAHIYFGWNDLRRINLATGVEELVAPLPTPMVWAVAVTTKWVFVVTNNINSNSFVRVAKPPL
jgi:hypothetical protein